MSHNIQHLQKSKGSDERYTPKWVFERLGIEFDIDVAAPIGGPRHTPSAHYYDITTDGLNSPWWGTVWMNPPYSAPKLWMAKFLDHGDGIALVATSQGKWFTDAWYDYRATFVPLPSMKFETSEGPMPNTAPFRCWLIGIGEKAQKGLDNFEATRG